MSLRNENKTVLPTLRDVILAAGIRIAGEER